MFLASDGVSEARNKSGAFYPLADRLTEFAKDAPATMVDSVWEDLNRYSEAIGDDVAMLVLSPTPAGAVDGEASPEQGTLARSPTDPR